MESKRVAGRSTRRRPEGGILLQTLKARTTIRVSVGAVAFRRNSLLLLYSSNLSGGMTITRVVRVLGDKQALRRGTSILVRRTGGGNNRSGVALIVTRCFRDGRDKVVGSSWKGGVGQPLWSS